MKRLIQALLTVLTMLTIVIVAKFYKLYNLTDAYHHEFVFHELPELDNRLELATLIELYKGKQFIHIDNGKSVGQMNTIVNGVFERWPSIQNYYLILDNDLDFSERDKFYHLKGDTLNLYKTFQDLSVDLIYLNGDYDYCTVLKTLQVYWAKLSYGGIMAGEKYSKIKIENSLNYRECHRSDNKTRALNTVDEFTLSNKIDEIELISDDSSTYTFYFMKRLY